MFWKKRPEIRQLFGHLSGYGCLTKYIETEEELMILASSVFGVQNFKDAQDLTSKINELKKKNKRVAKTIALSNARKLSLENMWHEGFIGKV